MGLLQEMISRIKAAKYSEKDPLNDGIPDDAVRDRQLRSMIRYNTKLKEAEYKKRLAAEILARRRKMEAETWENTRMRNIQTESNYFKKTKPLKVKTGMLGKGNL